VFIAPGALFIVAAMFRSSKRDIASAVVGRSQEARQLAALWVKLERAIAKAGIDTASSRTMSEIVADAADALVNAGNADAAGRLQLVGTAISQVLYGRYPVSAEDVKRFTNDVSGLIIAVNSLSKVARRR
jgi:hypothetical protein